jgi:plastocyanin
MSDEHGSRESLWLPILIPVGIFAAIAVVLVGFSRILLAVSHSAATVVALVVSASIVAVAVLMASRDKVTGTTLLTMLGAVAGITMLAGGGAVLAFGAVHEEEEGVVVTIAAEPNAAVDGFSTDALSFPSDEAVVLRFNNADPSVAHNVVIFDGEDAEAPSLFQGEIVTGPTEVDYDVPPLPEGDFFFHCEVHPTTMTGVITSEVGGGAGATISAENLEFNEKELDLPADQETTLAFDNEDPGVLHNVSIYTDETLTTALFQGEQFAGVATQTYDIPALEAGEYYFHCDVHPDMKGVVIAGAPKPGEGGQGTGLGGNADPGTDSGGGSGGGGDG